ncbi:MAG: SPOR domain-containing protein, partial [Spirochaetia bacterium]|nr:SPOR domain-containing protein [Spirochaetia bacterium]
TPVNAKTPTSAGKAAPKSESLFPEATPSELAQDAKSVEKYYLQLLVTSDKDKAEKNVDGLVKKNYKAYLRNRTDSAGKNLFLVRVGPYDDKSKALHDLGSLREKGGYKDSFIASQKSAPTKSSTQMMSREGAETNPKKSVLTSL